MPLRVPALIGCLLALVILALPSASPAAAVLARTGSPCTIRLGDRQALQQAADKADAVFAAKVVSVDKGKPGGTSGGGLGRQDVAWIHQVRVAAGFRGSPRKGGHAVVVLAPVTKQPGRQLTKGATYLFFAKQDGDQFQVARCGGLVVLRHGLTKPLRTRLTAQLGESEQQGVGVTLQPPTGGAHDLPQWGRLVAPGAALALIGLLGLFLVGRLARERSA